MAAITGAQRANALVFFQSGDVFAINQHCIGDMTKGCRRALHTGLSLFAEHVIAIQNACFFIEENCNQPFDMVPS